MQDYYHAFGGKYVGHDEPSVLYYSNVPGAGNRNAWQVTLPKDPPPGVIPGNTATGANCTIVPPADDGQPATVYPFFSITRFFPSAGRAGGSSGTAYRD